MHVYGYAWVLGLHGVLVWFGLGLGSPRVAVQIWST